MSSSTRSPVEAFFADPVRTGASISPDGTQIGYLASEENRLNVWIEPVDGGEPVCVTHDHNRGIHSYHWTGDPRWLLYTQDDDGDENWHIFRVDLERPDEPAVELTPFPKVVVHFELLDEDPHLALITMNRRRPDMVDVHRLHIVTGNIEPVAENPGEVAGWILGSSGAIFAKTLDDKGDETIHRWDPDTGLTALATFSGADNPLSLAPLQPTPSGDGLWVGSNRLSEHTQLVHISAADGTETVVAAHETMGVDETAAVRPADTPPPLIRSRDTGDLLAVRFLGDRQHIEVLDPEFAPVLAALSKLFEGDLASISSDKAGQRWVVSFTHDTDPGVTYFYDHPTGESRLLFRPYEHLDPASLAPMMPVTISSRDGLELHSFLTLPKGVEPSGLPLVLLVHGGPWFRDKWGFNPRVQLLANRGYAVLQVNMRGSTGYGKSFTRAAIGEFAGTMHEDLVDGVRWAVAEGIADPDRVVIFGGSYGGYSALVGATFTPEVFAAAIDYCGISSLANFIRTLPIQVRRYLQSNWFLYVGDPADPEQEADMLARSPITRLDAICRPLLVIQGANDVRVVQEESDAVVEALRARGADVEYLVKDNEGHGFTNPENNIDMFRTIERFLARTIGGEIGPSPAEAAKELAA
jgi:dipeptidyl aminopeptidase/acylaminoacyl peptidase